MKKMFLSWLLISLIFAAAFLGCGSDGGGSSSSDTDWSSVARAGAQGAVCGSAGTYVVGYVNTRSECAELCANKGYEIWCKGDDSTACFCG